MGSKAPKEKEAEANEFSVLASENVLSHAGEWVALIDRSVIAYGPSLIQVHREATARAKDRKPTYYAVPKGAGTY